MAAKKTSDKAEPIFWCSRVREIPLTSVGRTSAAALRLVLMVLASFADRAGVTYPSVATLAELTYLGRPAVSRALAGLELQGAIEAVGRRSKGGRGGDGKGIPTRWRLIVAGATASSGSGLPLPQARSTASSGSAK